MVAAALDAAAGWEAPQGRSPYDPMADILDYEPPAAGSSPLSWLLNGWAGGWQYGGEEGGKYVPNLLAAIKGASPSAQRSKFDPISGGCCTACRVRRTGLCSKPGGQVPQPCPGESGS